MQLDPSVAGREGALVASMLRLLRRRAEGQLGGPGARGGFSPAQRRHVAAFHLLPTSARTIVENMHSRAYTGQFSASGDLFVGARQAWHLGLGTTCEVIAEHAPPTFILQLTCHCQMDAHAALQPGWVPQGR